MAFIIIKHLDADVYGVQIAHCVALPRLLSYYSEYKEQYRRKNSYNCYYNE